MLYSAISTLEYARAAVERTGAVIECYIALWGILECAGAAIERAGAAIECCRVY